MGAYREGRFIFPSPLPYDWPERSSSASNWFWIARNSNLAKGNEMSASNDNQPVFYYPPYDLLPPHTPEARQQLKDGIQQEKQIHTPIVVDQRRRILDGRLLWELYQELIAEGEEIVFPDIQIVKIQSDEEGRNLRLELNLNRRTLSRSEKDDVIKNVLRHSPDMNSSWVGRICGADGKTVLRCRNELIAGGEIPPLPAYRCQDGRSRPATKVSVRSKRQLVKGCDLITKLGDDVPAGIVKFHDLAKAEREQQRAERAANAKPVTLDDIKLYHCDFRDLNPMPASVKLILTDPPYSKKYVAEWKHLPEFAVNALDENGILATYTPAMYFWRFLRAIRHRCLKHVWPAATAYGSTGNLIKLGNLNIVNEMRPVQVYVKGRFTRLGFHDLVQGSGREKTLHDWQQSPDEFIEYVEMLSDPGDLVCDPFLGTGTTAIACYLTGRRFIGCDIDEQAYLLANDALQRVIDEQQKGRDGNDGSEWTDIPRR